MAQALPTLQGDSIQTSSSTLREKRLRTLTSLGQLTYKTKMSEFNLEILKITNIINRDLDILRTADIRTLKLDDLRNSIEASLQRHGNVSNDVIKYLDGIRSSDSERDKLKHIKASEKLYEQIDSALQFIIREMSKPLNSQHSVNHSTQHSSKHSSRSSTSNPLILQQKAKVEAALTTLDYAKEQSEIEKRRAELERETKDLQSDLSLLNKRKQAAIEKAKLDAMVDEHEGSLRSVRTKSDFVTVSDRTERTRNYVSDQNKRLSHIQEGYPVPASHHTEPKPVQNPPSYLNHNYLYEDDVPLRQPESFTYQEHPINTENVDNYKPMPDNNSYAIQNTPIQQYQSPGVDLARFLLKKDLLLTRLTTFDEKPESYLAWKTSFRNVMTDLNVTPSEEIDLLVKWLGPESKKYANSIRSANIKYPSHGLKCIWERLNDRYGSPQMVESSLKKKLSSFPKLSNYKDYNKLYELSDILSEILSAKQDPTYSALLSYFDTSSGIIPIVCKLPYMIQNKWTSTAKKYMNNHRTVFPPFFVFVEFIREMSTTLNDPSFNYVQYQDKDKPSNPPKNYKSNLIAVKKTSVNDDSKPQNGNSNKMELCPLHKSKHSLNQCKGFKLMALSERKQFLHENKICFRCCKSHPHLFRSCKEAIKCDECGSDRHPTPLHVNQTKESTSKENQTESAHKTYPKQVSYSDSTPDSSPLTTHGGEEAVNSKCTQICVDNFSGRSCAKITLAKIYANNQPNNFIKGYIIHDDQSNQTLAKSEFFDFMNIPHHDTHHFTLTSCAGTQNMTGRVATGYMVESLDGSSTLDLPVIIECNDIPDNRQEIPTPEIATYHSHLSDVADFIPSLKNETPILLLIGRDLPEAHHILQQKTGPKGSPFAQRLNLGWVIVGEVCLGRQHQPNKINVKKTHVLNDGRSTYFPECPNRFESYVHSTQTDLIGTSVFQRTKNDERIGVSIEDKTFIHLMDNEFIKDSSNYWIAPLPFRKPRPRLPNNRPQAVKRAKTLHHSLQQDPQKREHFTHFMQKIMENGHAEIAPPLDQDEECWYLPIFGVYHPNKPDQIRAVFDSSARYEGHSLNSVLMSGPNLTNELLGVLLRFRKDPIAVMADIQQMFYCFLVKTEHRNFLRFLWYENNDPDLPLIEYRMTVHVFGNSPSPAVASYGLRKTVQDADCDVRQFVERNFYVDDGITSFPDHQQTIDVLQRTQKTLKEKGNLRLHKIASNSEEVMDAFPTEDLAPNLKDLDIRKDILPVQRSLGLCWDLCSDTFTYRLSNLDKPITRRGLLSTVNSLFDPLGFIAPVVIQGKILLRDVTSGTVDWDEPLSSEKISGWKQWESSLKHLVELNIQRTYVPSSFSQAQRREIHIYCDASEKAIAAVAYLKTIDSDNQVHVGFVFGKTKVAPTHGHSIPRLELCAAVLAVELAEVLSDHLDIQPNAITYYSDSRVVLGYIYNNVRRFYIYVGNRVDRIRKSSTPEQWNYISTDKNPADQGSRGIPAQDLQGSVWLIGPEHLRKSGSSRTTDHYDLINPLDDKELRPSIETKKTSVIAPNQLGTQRFSRFSKWKSLVEAIAHLKHIARSFNTNSKDCIGWHSCERYNTPEAFRASEMFIIKAIQHEHYSKEIECILNNKPLPQQSSIISLSPILDEYQILRVSGRLNKSSLPLNEKNPIIVPGKCHISTLLVRHFHEIVKHQGRHFTEGAIRSNGFWVIGAKRLISSVIHNCVKCKRLRGSVVNQIMSDLPVDRLQPNPPFTYVGLDVFGPWQVVSRRTRGGQANNKRWAILFTCLVTRCIHIELIEEMSSSSCINAIRRFIALRGSVKEFRSDRGSNFVGATNPLHIDAINVEDGTIKEFLYNSGTVWKFNSPHSSHMGGAWERLIGIVRRILDSMLLDNKYRNLTHEVLSTFMYEVTAIVNSRPITPVSTDPECPLILTPSVLLTQKTDASAPIDIFEDINIHDMYKAQWKYVQFLAENFWNRFRTEYLPTLQPRKKWLHKQPNIQIDDVVLLKDKNLHRNDWNTGLITNVFPGEDNVVRKVEIRIIRNGKPTVYIRPVSEIIPLIKN